MVKALKARLTAASQAARQAVTCISLSARQGCMGVPLMALPAATSQCWPYDPKGLVSIQLKQQPCGSMLS